MAPYRSPLTVTLWPSSFLKKYGPMIPPAHKAHQTRQSRFGLIRRIYALLDDRFDELPNPTDTKSLDSC
ncbi:hypothetical protein TNCV_3065721 [Trichonephila clavipes]|uniref:Uncharacterized protein n=1 Tax=Trichonephila clavipes TaxID=2585209 RepID=A0A8X6RNF4_TRICX|nr:hypothetical protein TNCV_3065721 [Trichonephila clavipes]